MDQPYIVDPWQHLYLGTGIAQPNPPVLWSNYDMLSPQTRQFLFISFDELLYPPEGRALLPEELLHGAVSAMLQQRETP